MDFDDFDDFLFGFNSLSIQEPESFKLEYVRNDIETSIDDDVELWRLFRSVRKDIVINRLAHQITMARSGFLLPLDTMAARLNFLLAELPRLQIPGGEPLKQFTVFPSLPPEIRNKIWKFAAFVPQTSGFWCSRAISGKPVFNDDENPPPILCTSREARREGMRYYTRCILRPGIWEPGVRDRIFYTKTHYINFEVHEFTTHLPMVFADFKEFDFHTKDLAKIQILTFGHYGYQPIHPATNIPLDMLGMLRYLPGLKELKIVIRNWCAQVGVNQGIGQELFRKEVHDNFQKYFEQALKDAGMHMKVKLRVVFKDWNDSDAAPCSADAAKGRGWRYFSPIANATRYNA